MRLTCLKCGHQFELPTDQPSETHLRCVCGQEHTQPLVLNTGTRPNEKAAERSRSRAFRAAGVAKNMGGFALIISLLGILCFPLGLIGACFGLYVLVGLRGPMARYSGRRQAIAALGLGLIVFVGEGIAVRSWFEVRKAREMRDIQNSALEDLRALVRAQKLYRATNDRYGSLREIGYTPRFANYTLYLSSDDYIPAIRDGNPVTDPLPDWLKPVVGVNSITFTAIAVGRLGKSEEFDVWSVTDSGHIEQLTDAHDQKQSKDRPE